MIITPLLSTMKVSWQNEKVGNPLLASFFSCKSRSIQKSFLTAMPRFSRNLSHASRSYTKWEKHSGHQSHLFCSQLPSPCFLSSNGSSPYLSSRTCKEGMSSEHSGLGKCTRRDRRLQLTISSGTSTSADKDVQSTMGCRHIFN